MRRSFKLLLAAVAMLALMCSGAWAEDINTGNKLTEWNTAGSPYTLTESVTISERITVTGEVRLILNDGCVLSADKGITVISGDSLTIEGGTAGTGKLIAGPLSSSPDYENAAIGGTRFQAGGNITIKGGIVEAESNMGAGIGGGNKGAGGEIAILGGKVDAKSVTGSGIGGGTQGDGGDITIDGGTVTASSSFGGAGIGGGTQGDGGTVKIISGKVTAVGEGGAGIGGGDVSSNARDNGGKITILGGTVDAKSKYGAGIGGGSWGDGGDITIDGGTVTAASTLGGAGIGGGANGGSGGKTKIISGTVTASSSSGAGIGGGASGGDGGGDGGDITIDGGTVTTSSYSGAGIGGGRYEGPGGNIVINGGTVTAASLSAIEEGGAGIGGGYMGAGGSIIINGGRVTASSNLASGIGRGQLESFQEEDDVDRGTLSSDPNGSACIAASSVVANTDSFNGVIFDESSDGNGKVYGSATVSGDVVISADKTLEVPEGATLTIEQGASLTVEDGAKLNVASGATFDASKGTLDNKGTVENDGIVKLPETMKPEDIEALGITGTGTVELDGKTYDNTGEEQAGEPEHSADASTIHDYVESAGLKIDGNKLTRESALAAINSGGGIWLNGGAVATDETISTLAIQSVDVVPAGYSELIFDKLSGSYLVSGGRTLGVDELNIVKVISADAAQLLVPTDGTDGKSAEELDGTFVISRDGRIVSTVNGAIDGYSLVVYIADDGRLDLARTVPGHVVDPLVLVKSTGGADGGSSGGGGGCSMGFGLAAVAALAALALRKRGR